MVVGGVLGAVPLTGVASPTGRRDPARHGPRPVLGSLNERRDDEFAASSGRVEWPGNAVRRLLGEYVGDGPWMPVREGREAYRSLIAGIPVAHESAKPITARVRQGIARESGIPSRFCLTTGLPGTIRSAGKQSAPGGIFAAGAVWRPNPSASFAGYAGTGNEFDAPIGSVEGPTGPRIPALASRSTTKCCLISRRFMHHGCRLWRSA
jgi:hypothetical protein